MVSVCLPSDALLQHLPSYLDFSYLGRGVPLHSCSSIEQPLLLTLDKRYLLTTTLPDLQHGMAPPSPPAPAQPPLLGRRVAPPGCRPWPRARGGCSRLFLRRGSLALSAAAPESAALDMPANLENSAVAAGLEKVSFHSSPKERQCQRMLKLPHSCPHLTC